MAICSPQKLSCRLEIAILIIKDSKKKLVSTVFWRLWSYFLFFFFFFFPFTAARKQLLRLAAGSYVQWWYALPRGPYNLSLVVRNYEKLPRQLSNHLFTSLEKDKRCCQKYRCHPSEGFQDLRQRESAAQYCSREVRGRCVRNLVLNLNLNLAFNFKFIFIYKYICFHSTIVEFCGLGLPDHLPHTYNTQTISRV